MSLTYEDWRQVVESAMCELAGTALSFDDNAVEGHEARIPDGVMGAYLALVSDESSVQVGLLSTPAGCQRLAKALLMMAPEDDDLPESDVSDAVAEIVNIAAGAIKGRVLGRAQLKLGLPLFIKGAILPSDRIDLGISRLRFGDVTAWAVCVHPRFDGALATPSGRFAAIAAARTA